MGRSASVGSTQNRPSNVSLREELERWIGSHALATSDAESSHLVHKREEIEHAMMVLEWLRRNTRASRAHRDYIAHRSITSIEKVPGGEVKPRGSCERASGQKEPEMDSSRRDCAITRSPGRNRDDAPSAEAHLAGAAGGFSDLKEAIARSTPADCDDRAAAQTRCARAP